MAGLSALLNMLGIETYINFDEPVWVVTRYDEYEKDTAWTGPGLAVLILSLMIGARCGMAIYEGNIKGGVAEKEEIQFKAWLIGVSVFAVLASIKDLFVEASTLGGIFDYAIAGVAFALLKPWHDHKLAALEADNSQMGNESGAERSLKSEIFHNLIMVGGVALFLGAFGAFALIGAFIYNFVGNEFGNSLLGLLAAQVYVIAVIIGGPIGWLYFADWQKRRKI